MHSKRKALISGVLTSALFLGLVSGINPVSASGKYAGKTITANFMASGTYDKAALEVKAKFEEETGGKVEIVAKPFDQLVQANLTDLAAGTGQYDVIL